MLTAGGILVGAGMALAIVSLALEKYWPCFLFILVAYVGILFLGAASENAKKEDIVKEFLIEHHDAVRVLRFDGWGEDLGQFVYENEDGEECFATLKLEGYEVKETTLRGCV